MSRSRILKRQAIDIAKKFKADINPDGPHEIASVYHEGTLVLTFGISHGKKGGHGHLVGRYGELKMSETKIMALASCSMSIDEYFQELKRMGEL